MRTVKLSDFRSFSLQNVQVNELLHSNGLNASLLCFEAGQRLEETLVSHPVVYQVVEGELLVSEGDDRERVGKGTLLLVEAGTPHILENAGGGLLVVLATRGSA